MAENTGSNPDKYEARLTQAVDYLRGNVKWTLIAFGAIGTTLLAGSQLSNLGKFRADEPRLWLALGCALLALGAAAYAVRSALAVAYSGYTELYSLKADDIAYVEKNKALLEGFSSVTALKHAYEKIIAERHREFLSDKKSAEALESNQIWFVYLDGLIDEVLSYVRYNRIRQQVEQSRSELTGASIVAAVALLGFAWAANPAIREPVIVLHAPASEARLTLTENGKKTLASVIGANCVAQDRIEVIVLSATAAGSEVVSLKTNDCPVARFTLNDSLGKLTTASP